MFIFQNSQSGSTIVQTKADLHLWKYAACAVLHKAVGEIVYSLSGDRESWESRARESRIYPVTTLTLPARHSRQESQTMAELQPEHCAAVQPTSALGRGKNTLLHCFLTLKTDHKKWNITNTRPETPTGITRHKSTSISADFLFI